MKIDFKPALALGLMWTVLAVASHGDTGHEGATRIEQGSYAETRVVRGSSATGTAFYSASVKRPDSMCRNNTSTAVWIGTTTAASIVGVNHPNIEQGIPLKSSETFTLGGSFTGTWAFTCDAAVTTCELRCADHLVR